MTTNHHGNWGCILAGGRAERMGGVHKGLIQCHDGRSVIEQLLMALDAAGVGRRMISANDPEPYRMLGCPLLPDRYAGCGPLGGIEAAMEFAVGQGLDNAGRVLFVPCDMPGITGLEMTALRVAAKENGLAMALFAGEAQPLVCAVSPVWLPAIREALEARRCSVLGLWERCGAVRVKMPSAQAGVNLNTGSDVDEWFRPPGGVTA